MLKYNHPSNIYHPHATQKTLADSSWIKMPTYQFSSIESFSELCYGKVSNIFNKFMKMSVSYYVKMNIKKWSSLFKIMNSIAITYDFKSDSSLPRKVGFICFNTVF